MTQKRFIVATAGHVDHGKSALVKALTGTDPDRLPEEKARGITIDLGFAYLLLRLPNDEEIHVGIIDVPGHEDFVKNMIAGVGSVDLALLVVAADDGWMPQTEEHLQILSYLGVPRAIVALTKSDLGDSVKIAAQIRDQLQGSSFADAKIVAISVRENIGIDTLEETVRQTLARAVPARDIGKPRLFVDRAFTLRGSGTVVTGTLTGGSFHRGQKIAVQPRQSSARIRIIQSHNYAVETAVPGMRTALNLPDLRVGDSVGGIVRGDVITAEAIAEPASVLDVLLSRSTRLQNTDSAVARPLKDGSLVHVHYGGAHFVARLALLDTRQLLPGEAAIAQLRFATPVLAFVGDRFVVRDSSEQHTIAGGAILDANANPKTFRTNPQRKFLAARAQSLADVSALVATELERDGFARRANLLLKSNFSAEEISSALQRLIEGGKVFATGALVADGNWWETLRQRAIGTIDAEHHAHPDHAGLDIAQLRAELDIDAPEVFEALLSDLCRDQFSRVGTAITRSSHRPALPRDLEPACARIRAALAVRPSDPPSRKELAFDANSQQALRFLRETGEIVELNDDAILSAESFARMQSGIVEFLRNKGPATVSDLRQALGTTRRIIVPLLEQLDRDGVTSRQGDRRILRRS